MFQRKNGPKYKCIKKSFNSLKNTPEYAIMQSSFTYRFKVNDTIVLKMNMVKFISHNTSYLSITSLYKTNHQ
uniref:Uncharacterized protein n=1 Tax=Octopus bimaculoides TaxID=37653 RepID=A0A0L8H855_OCTBM